MLTGKVPPVTDPHDPVEKKWRVILMLSVGYEPDDAAGAVGVSDTTARAWAAHRTMGTYDTVEEVTRSWGLNADRIGYAILEAALYSGSFGVVMRKFDVPPARFARWVMRRLNTAERNRADEVERVFARAGFPAEPPPPRKRARGKAVRK